MGHAQIFGHFDLLAVAVLPQISDSLKVHQITSPSAYNIGHTNIDKYR